jgi:PKD repeat protein
MLYNNNIIKISGMAIIGTLLFSSCKKNSATIAPDPFYAVSVNGFTATFSNQSKDATSYKWDFGDSTTSTEENPTHTYKAKGKYVPTLFASNSGVTKEASTVLNISKGSSIRMDDNTLSDWDTVTTNVVKAGAGGGNFVVAKYDYDGNNVYVYFEQHTTKAAGSIYDLYIDADNDPATGLITGDIPNGAYEVLMEGAIFNGSLDTYYHTGNQANFGGYAPVTLNEFYTVGTSEESGGILKFEFALKRSKIKGLSGQGMKIGVQVFSAGYAALVGYSPDLRTNAFFLDMSQ